jgi:hypothetical protein
MQRLVSSNEDRPADNLDNPQISLDNPSGVIEYSSDCYSNNDYVELEMEEPFRVFPPLFLPVSPVGLETKKNSNYSAQFTKKPYLAHLERKTH